MQREPATTQRLCCVGCLICPAHNMALEEWRVDGGHRCVPICRETLCILGGHQGTHSSVLVSHSDGPTSSVSHKDHWLPQAHCIKKKKVFKHSVSSFIHNLEKNNLSFCQQTHHVFTQRRIQACPLVTMWCLETTTGPSRADKRPWIDEEQKKKKSHSVCGLGNEARAPTCD